MKKLPFITIHLDACLKIYLKQTIWAVNSILFYYFIDFHICLLDSLGGHIDSQGGHLEGHLRDMLMKAIFIM